MKNKILIIGALPPPIGGMETFVKILSELKFENFEIKIMNVAKNKIIKLNIFFNVANFIYRCFKLIFLIIFLNPSIVHINLTSNKDFLQKKYFFYIAKFFKKKVIVHNHGGNFIDFYQNSKNKKEIEYIFKKADKVLVLTDSWKKKYLDLFNLNNIDFIYNPLDKNLYRYIQKKKVKKNFIVLYVGRLEKEKGVYDLLQAITLDNSKDTKYVFVGPFEDKNKFFSEVERLKIKDKIEVVGEVIGEERFKYFASADVLVLPSYAEGLPMVILEAFAFGLPVISTKVGGIPDVVKKENGILINPGDVKALAKSIKKIKASDLNKYRKINMKESEKYSVDKFKEKLEKIYEDLLKRK
ncbi:MAG: glycosyltransferase family 4 protein [Candidatus Woesearchaeota archaeon]